MRRKQQDRPARFQDQPDRQIVPLAERAASGGNSQIRGPCRSGDILEGFGVQQQLLPPQIRNSVRRFGQDAFDDVGLLALFCFILGQEIGGDASIDPHQSLRRTCPAARIENINPAPLQYRLPGYVPR